MGRRPKPLETAQTKRLVIQVSPGEHAEVMAYADALVRDGLTDGFAAWARGLLLAAARADAPKPPRKRAKS